MLVGENRRRKAGVTSKGIEGGPAVREMGRTMFGRLRNVEPLKLELDDLYLASHTLSLFPLTMAFGNWNGLQHDVNRSGCLGGGEPVAAAVKDLELFDEEGGRGRVGGAALGEVRPF